VFAALREISGFFKTGPSTGSGQARRRNYFGFGLCELCASALAEGVGEYAWDLESGPSTGLGQAGRRNYFGLCLCVKFSGLRPWLTAKPLPFLPRFRWGG